MKQWTTDAFLKRLYVRTEAERLHKRIRQHSEEYRNGLRQTLKRALGEFPAADVPLHEEVLGTEDFGDFLMERVAYTSMEDVHVPVLVLLPKQGRGPWPAVLACHGHGNGQRDAVGHDADGAALEHPGIHNRFAVHLVRKGMAVVIPEIMGFGVRRMEEELTALPNYSSCGTLSSQLLMYGRTLAGMRVYEAMRALDYLQSRQDIDSTRIGIFGFSGGGLIGAWTAALDERIQAAVLCGWTNTFKGSILAMHHCVDNYLQGLLLEAEQPELVSLVAPRAVFVEAGEKDPIFPVAHVREAVAVLEEAYDSLGAADRFSYDIFPGGHEISGRFSFDWLARRLEAQ